MPVYLEGPMAWEDPALPWHRRLLRTLGATFLPTESARAAAEGSLGPALRFALLSALPWAPLWAVVPFTHTLLFKSRFTVEVIESAEISIALDVARAMAVGLVLSVLYFLSWAFPFASLLRAFAHVPHQSSATLAAWRTALYRVWIVPAGMTLFWLITWGMPENPPTVLLEITFLCFQMLPRLLLVLHCHAAARYAGVSSAMALVVSILPVIVEWSAGLLVWHGAKELLPPMPESVRAGEGL